MERDTEIGLLKQCLELARGRRPFMTEDEALIPVQAYLDEARFEKELGLFRRGMNIVALSSQIASPGDFISRDVVGTPVIIVRDKDGAA